MNNSVAAPYTQPWTLERESEYRFELEQGEAIAIKLTGGHAEVYGAELAPNRWYHFVAECKAAVFSWEGCQLEVAGTPSTEYVSTETNLPALSNLHLALESHRLRSHRYQLKRAQRLAALVPSERTKTLSTEQEFGDALDFEDDAPRVMILGPEGSGKSTVVKTLTNWTTRSGRDWRPVVVNLDPSESHCSPPGTLSLTPHTHPSVLSSPAHSLGSPLPTGPPPSLASTLTPLLWWYGHPAPGQPGRTRLWQTLVGDMADSWEKKRKGDRVRASAGLIVDTNGRFVEPTLGREGAEGGQQGKYGFVREAVDGFKINVLVIVGHEKLHMEMQRMFGGPSSRIKIIKLPKSGGVVDHDASYRSRAQALQIRSYFYGDAPSPAELKALPGNSGMNTMDLSPHSTVVKFKDLAIFRVGEEYIAPSSALPIGASRTISETQLIKVDPTLPAHESKLLNAVLALVRVPASVPTGANAGGEDVKPNSTAPLDVAAVKSEDNMVVQGETVEGEVGEELAKSEIAGFVVITAVDTVREKFTILSPNPGKLPSRTALVGSFEWQEM